ncbi:hypothetical protein GH733_019065 [Mirounga leonina]|nr:hypothetical protein GH733_019065 [Mirounga leonina]
MRFRRLCLCKSKPVLASRPGSRHLLPWEIIIDTLVWVLSSPKEVATATRGAILLAKLSVVPVGQSYWGNKISKPRTIPYKIPQKFKEIKPKPQLPGENRDKVE